MPAPPNRVRSRSRGQVRSLPSGAFQVTVYAGVDALTGKRIYLRETVPAGPRAATQAEKVRARLLNQVDENRNPRTAATVDQLMDRYLEVVDVDRTTRKGYEGYINNHVRPLLGHLPVGRLDGETLDSFYTVLRNCRAHCRQPRKVDHRTAESHDCDDRCRPHICRPLAASSIRQVHGVLSGALTRAVRWRWIAVNPLAQAEPPRTVRHDPNPPSPEQAAVILKEAFRDPAWGMLVWLAMITGARRGELCALRLDGLDLTNSVIAIRSSIAQDGSETWEKDTKTHQQRRITLDQTTVALLAAYVRRCDVDAAELGITPSPSAYLFSSAPDHSTWLKPGTVTQRYRRMCARLGFEMHIHQLRHYSATELIAAGVDVRTVAGRLGHGGGGATTLRVYSAWVAEADQRAAGHLAARLPALPISLDVDMTSGSPALPAAATDDDRQAPYQKIAADLRGAIGCGAIKPGEPLPTVKELCARYAVSAGTAHRAVELVTAAGMARGGRGRRVVVQ